MQPRFVLFLVAAGLYIPALLIADTRGLIPQLALGLATLAFLGVFAQRSEAAVRQIIWAILVATTGEIVLSLSWGLYTDHGLDLWWSAGPRCVAAAARGRRVTIVILQSRVSWMKAAWATVSRRRCAWREWQSGQQYSPPPKNRRLQPHRRRDKWERTAAFQQSDSASSC